MEFVREQWGWTGLGFGHSGDKGEWGGPPGGLDAQLGRMAQGEGGFAFLFFGFYFPFISFLFSFSFLFYYSFVKYQNCT